MRGLPYWNTKPMKIGISWVELSTRILPVFLNFFTCRHSPFCLSFVLVCWVGREIPNVGHLTRAYSSSVFCSCIFSWQRNPKITLTVLESHQSLFFILLLNFCGFFSRSAWNLLQIAASWKWNLHEFHVSIWQCAKSHEKNIC